MNITRENAIAMGYTIDDHCNPPIAYKGPRFNPEAWTTTYTEREDILITALLAVKARINGEFDHPALMAYGELHVDSGLDVKLIIDRALNGERA